MGAPGSLGRAGTPPGSVGGYVGAAGVEPPGLPEEDAPPLWDPVFSRPLTCTASSELPDPESWGVMVLCPTLGTQRRTHAHPPHVCACTRPRPPRLRSPLPSRGPRPPPPVPLLWPLAGGLGGGRVQQPAQASRLWPGVWPVLRHLLGGTLRVWKGPSPGLAFGGDIWRLKQSVWEEAVGNSRARSRVMFMVLIFLCQGPREICCWQTRQSPSQGRACARPTQWPDGLWATPSRALTSKTDSGSCLC